MYLCNLIIFLVEPAHTGSSSCLPFTVRIRGYTGCALSVIASLLLSIIVISCCCWS